MAADADELTADSLRAGPSVTGSPTRRSASCARCRGRRPRRAPRARHPPGLQDGRHLRRRVRGDDAVPLLLLRRGDRGRAARQARGAHPRQRAEPDRPGHRVRLLLRARRDGAARGRLRDRDGQLQPRDRVDRLRHRPAVLRAADPRGRARGRARRARGRPVAGVIVQLGGQTPLGLAQGLEDAGVPIVGTSPDAIHLAEDRGRSAGCSPTAGLPAPKYGMATSDEDALRGHRRHRLPGARPPVLRPRRPRAWRSSTTTRLAGYIERATEVTPEHPVLVDRFLDDAVEIDVDALYDGRRALPRRA